MTLPYSAYTKIQNERFHENAALHRVEIDELLRGSPSLPVSWQGCGMNAAMARHLQEDYRNAGWDVSVSGTALMFHGPRCSATEGDG